MFTGLIETQGVVTHVQKVSGGAKIQVYAPEFGRDMALGDSIAVDGACLTVAQFQRGAFVADVSDETLSKTTLGGLHQSSKVNLERAMRLADERGTPHPGALHMYLHTMEMSPHPEKALRASDTLRDLVPEAGHLRHMPSHIDILCGHYYDAMKANEKAIVVDQKYLEREGPLNFYTGYRCHDIHFRLYAAMFLGQSRAALEAAGEMDRAAHRIVPHRHPRPRPCHARPAGARQRPHRGRAQHTSPADLLRAVERSGGWSRARARGRQRRASPASSACPAVRCRRPTAGAGSDTCPPRPSCSRPRFGQAARRTSRRRARCPPRTGR